MGAIAEGFAAFAQPLLDQTDGSMEQMQRAFTMSQLCYNLALLPEDQRESSLSELRVDLKMDDEEFAEFRRTIVDPMVRRHQEMFPLMHGRISSSDLLERVSSLPAQPRMVDRVETYSKPDRYAPCPCNSGRKFKFCCGAKGR
jgi:hypothetical protein